MVSISDDAVDILQKFKDSIQKAKIGETTGAKPAKENLNDAVSERVTTGRWEGTKFILAEPLDMVTSPEDMENWPPENRELYKQIEKELQAIHDRMPDHPPDRSKAILKEVAIATNKMFILGTFGESHSMTEEMLEEAANVFDEAIDEHNFKKTGITRDGDLLGSLTPEEVEEKLRKLQDELINKVNSGDGRATSIAQQGASNKTLHETPNNLDGDKPSTPSEAHDAMNSREMQRMNYGLQRYEKAASFK